MKLPNMSIEQLTNMTLPAILIEVRTGGKVESLTIFISSRYVRDPGRGYQTPMGSVDIAYSYGASYKMLDRKDSGLYTGTPLAGEKITFTTYQAAYDKVKAIYRKSRKAMKLPVH